MDLVSRSRCIAVNFDCSLKQQILMMRADNMENGNLPLFESASPIVASLILPQARVVGVVLYLLEISLGNLLIKTLLRIVIPPLCIEALEPTRNTIAMCTMSCALLGIKISMATCLTIVGSFMS